MIASVTLYRTRHAVSLQVGVHFLLLLLPSIQGGVGGGSSLFLQHLCRLNLADAVYLVAYGEEGDGCNDEDREQEVE